MLFYVYNYIQFDTSKQIFSWWNIFTQTSNVVTVWSISILSPIERSNAPTYSRWFARCLPRFRTVGCIRVGSGNNFSFIFYSNRVRAYRFICVYFMCPNWVRYLSYRSNNIKYEYYGNYVLFGNQIMYVEIHWFTMNII
jgi:hypothetical protein